MIDWSKIEKAYDYDKLFDNAVTQSISYLKETDWQVIAMIERQRPMPEDVRVGRVQALDIVTKA